MIKTTLTGSVLTKTEFLEQPQYGDGRALAAEPKPRTRLHARIEGYFIEETSPLGGAAGFGGGAFNGVLELTVDGTETLKDLHSGSRITIQLEDRNAAEFRQKMIDLKQPATAQVVADPDRFIDPTKNWGGVSAKSVETPTAEGVTVKGGSGAGCG